MKSQAWRLIAYSSETSESYLVPLASHLPCQIFCGRSSFSALKSSHKGTARSPVIKENAHKPTRPVSSFWLCSSTLLSHQDPWWCCESVSIPFCVNMYRIKVIQEITPGYRHEAFTGLEIQSGSERQHGEHQIIYQREFYDIYIYNMLCWQPTDFHFFIFFHPGQTLWALWADRVMFSCSCKGIWNKKCSFQVAPVQSFCSTDWL